MDGATRLTEWSPEHWSAAPDWQPVLNRFLSTTKAQQLGRFISQRLTQGAIVYPPQPLRALALTPLAQVRVVILGQDPYHGPGQAEGLAFSVAADVKPPPSLRNIFKEIARDPALEHNSTTAAPSNGSLIHWTQQGVLLLNTCLTVEQGQPASHAQRGWELLTDDVVKTVAQQKNPVVFLLWGAHAQAKQALIASIQTNQTIEQHLVLTANHPSPLSANRPPKPFLGCGHFSATNHFLQQHQQTPIDW